MSKIKMILVVLAIPVLIAAGFAVYVYGSLHMNYSSGERSGFVQKLSKKGWVCKTWEGEMAMVSMPGTAPEIFNFSVRDDAVADKINRNMGKRVALIYEQHKGVPTTCFGETDYYVIDIKPVE